MHSQNCMLIGVWDACLRVSYVQHEQLLWSPWVADADIIFCPVVSSSWLLYFLAYSQPSQIGCLSYFHTWCGLSANLGCRSETCCTRLPEIQDAKYRQKFAICAQSHNFVGLYLRNKGTRRQSGKHFKQEYLLHVSSQYGELRRTSGWDRFVSLGHPSKFQPVSHYGFVTAPTSLNGGQPNFARCLAVSWAGTLYITFSGALAP